MRREYPNEREPPRSLTPTDFIYLLCDYCNTMTSHSDLSWRMDDFDLQNLRLYECSSCGTIRKFKR